MDRLASAMATAGFAYIAGGIVIASAILSGLDVETGLYAMTAWVTITTIMVLTLATPGLIKQEAAR